MKETQAKTNESHIQNFQNYNIYNDFEATKKNIQLTDLKPNIDKNEEKSNNDVINDNNGRLESVDKGYNSEFIVKKNTTNTQNINSYSEMIEKLGITKKARLAYFLANFLQFIWGMEACFISINLERLANNSSVPIKTKAALISIIYSMLGIGSALMGILTKVLGRIRLIVFSTVVYALFVLLSSLPILDNFYAIFSFRCIANIALGIFNISILNLLTEYLPIQNRSYVLMVNSGLYNFGNIFMIITNNIFLSDINKNFNLTSWRIINLICAMPSLISLIFSIFYVEESPLYLINNEHKNHSNSSKAFKILKEMSEGKNVDFNEEVFNRIKFKAKSLEGFKLKSHYSELFHIDYLRLTICNIMLCTIFYFNMIGISYITPKTVNEKRDQILNISFDTQMLVYSIIQLPNGYLGGLMTESDFFGRKKTIWISSFICAMFYLIIHFLPYYLCFYAGGIMFFNSIGFGAAFIYVSEIYPTNLRDQAQSLIQCISFLIGAFAPFIIDYFYASSFILLGVTCLVCLIVIVFVGEETHKRPLDYE